MFQIDTSTAVATEPAAGTAGTPGWFTGGNPALNQPATVVSADWLNAVQDELMNVVNAAGLTPSKTTHNQVLQALDLLIEARTGNYAIDTGTANNYVIALSPPIGAYTENFSFQFRALHANTGACLINFGPGNVPLDRDDGSAMQQGDITANCVIAGDYDFALNKALVSSIVPSQLGALAKLNIGLGVENDGGGNLAVKTAGDGSLRLTAAGLQANFPIEHIAANLTIAAANHFTGLVNTAGGGVTLDLPACSTLWNGFVFGGLAQAGTITLAPNAANTITVGSVAGAEGAPLTVKVGAGVIISIDDTGNWLVQLQGTAAQANASSDTGTVAAVQGAGTIGIGQIMMAVDADGTLGASGTAISTLNFTVITAANTGSTVQPGNYAVDTTGGPVTLKLSTVLAVIYTFADPTSSWGANTFTVDGNGSEIGNLASNVDPTFPCAAPDCQFSLIAESTYWRLF